MHKRELYTQLLPFGNIYRGFHPRTSEIDIAVIRKISEGKGTVQTAMEVPCSEATVYRAVNRVKRFLTKELEPCRTAGLSCAAKEEKT